MQGFGFIDNCQMTNKETVKNEKVKDDDGEKRMTRKEWEEYERKNKKNKGRS